tara:strand:+ start:646 stop:924 length:279 start_codon:yes stop_codon:yes gene_type:complete
LARLQRLDIDARQLAHRILGRGEVGVDLEGSAQVARSRRDQADVKVQLGQVEVRTPRARLVLEHLSIAVDRVHQLVPLLVRQALEEHDRGDN